MVAPRNTFDANALKSMLRIALLVGVVALAFAYTAGWLSPHRLTPEKLVAALLPPSGPASAEPYPVKLIGAVHLPLIVPISASLHSVLWTAHHYLALAFFALILLHLAAALFHLWVRDDGVFEAMATRGERIKTR